MVSEPWRVILSTQAMTDKEKLKAANLADRAKGLLELLQQNPFTTPPRFEKLRGDLAGMYSRRINIQHRLVYSVDTKTRTVRVLRMWTHYE